MQPGFAHERLQAAAVFVVGINLKQRRRPEPAFRISCIDLSADLRRPDLDERTGECLILADQPVIKLKDVHVSP